MDKDLAEAIKKIEEDGNIGIILKEPTPDNSITILTQSYMIVIGANECGFWLESFKKKGASESEVIS